MNEEVMSHTGFQIQIDRVQQDMINDDYFLKNEKGVDMFVANHKLELRKIIDQELNIAKSLKKMRGTMKQIQPLLIGNNDYYRQNLKREWELPSFRDENLEEEDVKNYFSLDAYRLSEDLKIIQN